MLLSHYLSVLTEPRDTVCLRETALALYDTDLEMVLDWCA
jgi:hypothetical protein